MSIFSMFHRSQPKTGEQLTEAYFRFLVDTYGFTYAGYAFRSDPLLIQVQPGHKTPRVVFNKIGEPDPDLFYLELEWIVGFFRGTEPTTGHDYLRYSLEENMGFVSQLFRGNAERLINDFENWWIPVHLFLYKWMERKAKEEGRLENFHENHEYYSDYLKSKGAIE